MTNLVLDNLFTAAELAAYSHVFPDGINVTALKALGDVTITDTEKDDVITRTIDFASFDGQTAFTKTHSFYKYKAGAEKVRELRRLMMLAADEDTVEGYLRAARIKNQLEALLLTL